MITALGTALLHFLWQGAAGAALLAAALWLIPQRRSNLRYAAALAILALMAAAPVATFVVLLPAAPARESVFVTAVSILGGTHAALVGKAPPAAPDLRELLMPGLVLAWAIGAFLLSLRLGLGLWRVERLARRSRPAPSEWEEAFATLKKEMGIRFAVSLRTDEAASSPMTIGIWRRIVIVSLSSLARLSPDVVEALMIHELAHIRRHDFAVNLLQSVVETLLFYHPAVWWVSHVVRQERENCCDDAAVSVLGSRLAYARALASLEEHRLAMLPVSAAGGRLKKRIQRIMGINSRTTQLAHSLPAALLVPAILVAAGAAVASQTMGPKKDLSKTSSSAGVTVTPVLAPGAVYASSPGRFALSFKNADIKAAVITLARTAGIKLEVRPGIYSLITLDLKKADIKTALHRLADAAGARISFRQGVYILASTNPGRPYYNARVIDAPAGMSPAPARQGVSTAAFMGAGEAPKAWPTKADASSVPARPAGASEAAGAAPAMPAEAYVPGRSTGTAAQSAIAQDPRSSGGFGGAAPARPVPTAIAQDPRSSGGFGGAAPARPVPTAIAHDPRSSGGFGGAAPAALAGGPGIIDISAEKDGSLFNLDVTGGSLVYVLREFSRASQVNVIVDEGEYRKINVYLKLVDMPAALGAILKAAGATYEIEGGVYYVHSKQAQRTPTAAAASNRRRSTGLKFEAGNVEMNLDNVPIEAAIKSLSAQTGLPILIKSQTTQTTLISISSAPLGPEEALKAICRAGNAKLEKSGSRYVVTLI